MKSKKAKEIIDNDAILMNNGDHMVDVSIAYAAIEIAEQEMREKAIQAFISFCKYDIECTCFNRKCNIDECIYLKAFINELNHEENNV